jgi:hypothetical protein
MFPRQVFGLTGSTLLAGLPGPLGSVSIRRSYLLTAAGQFRTFTGFPFHSRSRETQEPDHHILGLKKLQCLQIVNM